MRLVHFQPSLILKSRDPLGCMLHFSLVYSVGQQFWSWSQWLALLVFGSCFSNTQNHALRQNYASVLMVLRCGVLFCQCCSSKYCCSSAFGVMLLMLLSCLGVTLFFCFRSLRTVSLAFAAVLWACPHCCPYSCPTYLLAPADSCYSLRNPTRVQVSWFCCLCILVSLYVDLFIACSIMFVDASCSESEARFEPPAGVLQYDLCSRIDLWYDFTKSACKLLCNM